MLHVNAKFWCDTCPKQTPSRLKAILIVSGKEVGKRLKTDWSTWFSIVHNGGLQRGGAHPSGSITSVLANFSLNLHPAISHSASTRRSNLAVCKTSTSALLLARFYVDVTSWEANPCGAGIRISSVQIPFEVWLFVSVSSAHPVTLQALRFVSVSCDVTGPTFLQRILWRYRPYVSSAYPVTLQALRFFSVSCDVTDLTFLQRILRRYRPYVSSAYPVTLQTLRFFSVSCDVTDLTFLQRILWRYRPYVSSAYPVTLQALRFFRVSCGVTGLTFLQCILWRYRPYGNTVLQSTGPTACLK
jgi:hypothetical protein